MTAKRLMSLLTDLQGVISYSVHPGGIDTPLARNMPPAFHRKSRHPRITDQVQIENPVNN